MGPPGSGQSSKIANQMAVASGEKSGRPRRVSARQFLGTISKGVAGSRNRDFVLGHLQC
jgi:hypothetical protein